MTRHLALNEKGDRALFRLARTLKKGSVPVFLALLVLVPTTLGAQSKAKAENVPEIPITSVPNFFKLPPDMYFGEGIGIATNSKGHIFVYTRSGDTRLLEFDQNGNYVREIGQGLYGLEFAHAVRVDKDDNIWVVDEGTNMVIKFNPEGRVTDGARPPAGAGRWAPSTARCRAAPPEKYRFGRPTDVTWDAQGNIFVSDGYVNSRVVKYDKNGRFLEVGRHDARLGAEQLNTPHSITSDAQGNIYVGDRGNARVQVFDNNLILQRDLRQRRQPVGGVRLAAAASVSCSSRTRIPTATPPPRGRSPARSTRWSWTARSSASSARPARSSASSARIHEIDCRNPDQLFVVGDLGVARAEDRAQRETGADDRRQAVEEAIDEATDSSLSSAAAAIALAAGRAIARSWRCPRSPFTAAGDS